MKYFLFLLILIFFLVSCKTANVHLASDAKSGKYIGIVQNEVRDYESKKIIYFEIATDTEILRKTPSEIKIYEP